MPKEEEDEVNDAPPQEDEKPTDGDAGEDAQDKAPDGDAPPEEGGQVDENAPPDQPAEEAGEGDEQAPADGDVNAQESSQAKAYFYDDSNYQKQKKEDRDKKLAELKELRMANKADFASRLVSQNKQIEAGAKIINLTRCFGCSDHKWCTQHKEKKYEDMEQKFVAAVAENLGAGWYVAINCFDIKNVIGSFEIRYGDQVYFSKLEKMYWPCMKTIANNIKDADTE